MNKLLIEQYETIITATEVIKERKNFELQHEMYIWCHIDKVIKIDSVLETIEIIKSYINWLIEEEWKK